MVMEREGTKVYCSSWVLPILDLNTQSLLLTVQQSVMYSKNKLLYKTGLKRAWVSWAKSENGRENAMVRHNLYNLAAYLCQEFWVVFLPLPPPLASPSTSPPPSVELFFNKRPPSPCGWGDKPLLFTRKFLWHIDFGNLLRFHDF